MENTAMNQMLEELIAHEWEIPMTLIVKAKELVQVEKEQIMKSFKSARIPYKYDADFTLNGFENAEQYYNETYGNK